MLVEDLVIGNTYKQIITNSWSPIKYVGTEDSWFGVLYVFTRLDRYDNNKSLWDIVLYEDNINNEVIK